MANKTHTASLKFGRLPAKTWRLTLRTYKNDLFQSEENTGNIDFSSFMKSFIKSLDKF